MPTPDLERLNELHGKTTKGEWKIGENEGQDEAWCEWHKMGPFTMMGGKANDNELLVVELVNAFPDIIAYIESLEKKVKAWDEAGCILNRDLCDCCERRESIVNK